MASRFRHSKSLGQNFLSDEAAAARIAKASGAGPGDLLVEIGAGAGMLTRHLAENAGRVLAVEIDERLLPILKQRLSGIKNVDIINDDILKVDFEDLVRDYGVLPDGRKAERLLIAGNLPYYISTPILLGLLEKRVPAESVTVMLQKEFADKVTAAPASPGYGVLAVLLQYCCEAERILEVSRESFHPRPKVDSSVIRLSMRPGVFLGREYAACVKKAFSARRKTLGNALSGYRGAGKEEAAALIRATGIDPARRAETLTTEEFARLTEAFAGI